MAGMDTTHNPEQGPVNILLLASDDQESARVQRLLWEVDAVPFQLIRCRELNEAVERLPREATDLVLVAGSDSSYDHGATCDKLRSRAPQALLLSMADEQGTQAASGPLASDWLSPILRYIDRRKSAQAASRAADDIIFEEKERAEVTLNSIGDAVLVTNHDGQVTYLNPNAEELTGWSLNDANGHELDDVFHIVEGETRTRASNPARRAIDQDQTVGLAADCVLIRPDGNESGIEDSAAPIHDREGRVTGAVIIFREVSQSREVTRRMAHLATHDSLTDLPNRVLLHEQLQQAIRLAQRHGQRVALLYLDLDNFKETNDTLGHVIGDRVLQAVGERITATVRSSDTVCRQGGDEFVVLLSEISSAEDAADIAAKIRNAFAEPVVIEGHTINIGMCIGLSVNPDDADSAEGLLAHADAAMYSAKRERDPALPSVPRRAAPNPAVSLDRERTERDLQRALTQKEFILTYQPQVELVSGRILSMEVLLRWSSPAHGLVPPGQFVPLAEQSGLIIPIGRWALETACRQCSTWVAAGLQPPPFSVNVSAVEVSQSDFPEAVARILEETGVDANRLELELTETALIEDVRLTQRALESLREMGVQLAIDDFGSGYASLSYLRRFPFNTLKVDRSFLKDIGSSTTDAIILRSVVELGRSLGHRVIVEGIETDDELDFVQGQSCEVGQGFLLGRPLRSDDTARLLARQR